MAILKERIIRTYTAIALTNISFYFLDETSFNLVKDKTAKKTINIIEIFILLEIGKIKVNINKIKLIKKPKAFV